MYSADVDIAGADFGDAEMLVGNVTINSATFLCIRFVFEKDELVLT